MSKFTGKCDLFDELQIQGGFDNFKKRYPTVYIGQNTVPLKYETEKDLVPFYGHIDIMSYGTPDGNGVMVLSERDWITMEEERYGHMEMHAHMREQMKKELEKWGISDDE